MALFRCTLGFGHQPCGHCRHLPLLFKEATLHRSSQARQNVAESGENAPSFNSGAVAIISSLPQVSNLKYLFSQTDQSTYSTDGSNTRADFIGDSSLHTYDNSLTSSMVMKRVRRIILKVILWLFIAFVVSLLGYGIFDSLNINGSATKLRMAMARAASPNTVVFKLRIRRYSWDHEVIGKDADSRADTGCHSW